MTAMKYINLVVILFFLLSKPGLSQDSVFNKNLPIFYNQAYGQLDTLLKQNHDASFKKAVFITENTFLGNTLNYEAFAMKIGQMAFLINAWAKGNPMREYRYADSLNMTKNYGVFILMKDSIKIIRKDTSETLYTIPFTYDFEDFNGKENWTKMFVTKLLYTYSGNCHNLPYLYKILADEVGASCWLSLAPNHIYIKNRCKKSGWYNTELTSGSFPVDAWITGSGYIPLEAIQNGIYMDTLSNQQAIALCVLDLAKGYEFQTKNYYDGFIIQCCDLVLKYHPKNVQAILLKAETLKRIYDKQDKVSDSAAVTFGVMESLYTRLFELGYREMPEGMYREWLQSVVKEKEKYENKKL